MIFKDLTGKFAIVIADDYSITLRFPTSITSNTVTAELRKKLDKTTICSFTVTKDALNDKRATFSIDDTVTATLSGYAGTKQLYRIRIDNTTLISGEIEIKS